MSFEQILLDDEENYERRTYWKPEMIGEYLEGWITEFADDDFGNQRIRLKSSGNGNFELPAHASLKRYYNKLNVGDYIKVEVASIDEDSYDYPIIKYSVFVDPDNFDEEL